MSKGTVKWFDESKGFGFITQENGVDVFVQYSAIKGEGYKTMAEGDLVSFDVVEGDKCLKASNIERSKPKNQTLVNRIWFSIRH